MSEQLLQIEELNLERGGRRLLDVVSLTIGPGVLSHGPQAA
ncbi:hypothetical protein Thiowin_03842 [Thiorhodovibrio winogradskyi]|uniref:Uncharacterized protein n=1 Tax=Thiorhodovibrio winogradskyi TaxID=77007 RepID=A0ABZ0SCX0_9GAMM|nr:hypothetical protein [Thiorhodovibrio winogradskyi]